MQELNAQGLLSLYSPVAALMLLPRTSWLRRGIPDTRHVAEHPFSIVLPALQADSITRVDRGELLA